MEGTEDEEFVNFLMNNPIQLSQSQSQIKLPDVSAQPHPLQGTSKGQNGGLIIEYMDFMNQRDNSSYVPDLTVGVLQPVEIFDPEVQSVPDFDPKVDKVLSQMDMDAFVQPQEKQ